MNKYHPNPYLILLLFILVVIGYHIFGYVGHFGYDDMLYAEIASDFLKGQINYEDHFTFRFPVILFTALSYKIFGISDFASSLPSLILTIFTLFMVFLLLKNKELTSLIIGLSTTTLSPWFIFYSDKLMPDMYIVFSLMAAVTCIHQYKFTPGKKSPVVYAFLFVLALLFGFMAKGTIILSLPLWLYLFVVDMIKKRDQRFWNFSVIFGVGLLALYFFSIWILTGDVFKRFEAITSNSYLNLCSYSEQPVGILLKRITIDFITMLIYQSMAPAFIFVVAMLSWSRIGSFLAVNDSNSFFWTTTIILLLSSNFMTISFTSYSPMCIDPRHYLFLLPVASIPVAEIVSRYKKTKKHGIPIFLGLIFVTVVSFFQQGNTGWLLYLPLTLLFGLYFFIPRKPAYQQMFAVLFVLILAIKPFSALLSARKIDYSKQKTIFQEYILEKEKNAVVVTNDVQKRLARYYNRFDIDSSLEFISYHNFNPYTVHNNKTILFRNWYTRYLANMEFKELPHYAREISPSNPVIYENKVLNLSIYELKDFTRPELIAKTLLHSLNDFEYPTPNWKQRKENITEALSYKGTQAAKVPEFSATFEYPMDSFYLENAHSLIIKSQLFCNFYNHTDAKLVISVENEAGTYLWHELAINKQIKAYSNWWSVDFETTINVNELKEGSLLKVFLWNTDKETGFIDDFEVTITGLFYK